MALYNSWKRFDIIAMNHDSLKDTVSQLHTNWVKDVSKKTGKVTYSTNDYFEHKHKKQLMFLSWSI